MTVEKSILLVVGAPIAGVILYYILDALIEWDIHRVIRKRRKP